MRVSLRSTIFTALILLVFWSAGVGFLALSFTTHLLRYSSVQIQETGPASEYFFQIEKSFFQKGIAFSTISEGHTEDSIRQWEESEILFQINIEKLDRLLQKTKNTPLLVSGNEIVKLRKLNDHLNIEKESLLDIFQQQGSLAVVESQVFHNTFINLQEVSFSLENIQSGLSVLREIISEEIVEDIVDFTTMLTILFIAMLIIGFIASAMFTEQIIGPISKLLKGARAIEKGDFAVRIKTQSNNEIGELGSAFNSMAEDLGKSYEELETRVKERTKEVEHEKSKLNTALQSMGDGSFILDKDQQFIFFNKAAEEISGFKREEVIGKKLRDVLKFIREKDETDNYSFIDEAYSKGKVTHIKNHTFLVTKEGHRVTISDSAAPVRDNKGGIVGVIVVFRDSSREREIDKMKTEFISLASHQLRTPLTAIRWLNESLLAEDAGKLSAEQKDMLQKSHISVIRMNELINSLLNISRIEAQQLSVTPESTNVNEVSEAIINEIVSGFKMKGQKITFKKKGNLPIIKTDPGLLQEIISNLLINANKYTNKNGKIGLTITQDKKQLLFAVKDNGVGIPQHQQKNIFQKFFRADNVKQFDTTGSGLGLYIVSKLVKTLGGKIWFESVKDKGTTFFFTLPIAGIKQIKGEKKLA